METSQGSNPCVRAIYYYVLVAQLVEHSTFNAVVMRSSRIGDTSGGLFMTIEMQKLAARLRYNHLAANGRNVKSTGVLRKLARQMRNLEALCNGSTADFDSASPGSNPGASAS